MPAKTKGGLDWQSELGGIALLALALLGFLAIINGESGSWLGGGGGGAGAVGRILAGIFRLLAGEGRYLIPAALVLLAVRMILNRRFGKVPLRSAGVALLLASLLAALHLGLVGTVTFREALAQGRAGLGGGIIGAIIAKAIFTFFGPIGSYIVLGAGFLASLVMITNISLLEISSLLVKITAGWYTALTSRLRDFLFTVEEEQPVRMHTGGRQKAQQERAEARTALPEQAVPPPIAGRPAVKIYPEPQLAQEKEPSVPAGRKVIPMPVRQEELPFELPPLSLVQKSPRLKNPRANKDISDNVRLLEETLENFGVKAKVTQVSCGPAITRYELQPAPGVKVSKIVNLSDDIALSLAAPGVRIEAPIPGKAALGIEVPNKEIALVQIREVLESPEFMDPGSLLTVALGKDIAGNPVVADLSRMPHLLIAGATGSGKSVCMNSLIISLLFKCRSSELKFLMIDPKMVELTNFNGIPHLLSPVLTDAKKAAIALRWMVGEMENRYELFATAGVRDISRYNALQERLHPEANRPALPYSVVLIDELADLMMVAPADVEDAICRLAQMARAAGIHLVVATQRPSVDVITGIIKANIPSRVAFAVSSQTDSRTILDMGGAEKLLGRGDMLFFPVGATKPIRVQGVYVSDREVDDIVEFLSQQGQPSYVEGLEGENLPLLDRGQDEDLLPEAVRLFIESGQASISLLQRRLHIGYTRAARLIDLMEERGIIGGFEGSKPRPVLITWEEYTRRFGG